MKCIAMEVRHRNYDNHVAMFKDALKHKSKFYKSENERTRYYCIVFSDKSRLTFKLCEDSFYLMSWYYYI